MSFAWAFVLPALLLVPLFIGGYAIGSRRRRRDAVVHPNVALLRDAGPRRAGWKRHAPAGLLLTALTCLLVAGARPQLQAEVPVSSSALILALDVSASMCATDVKPNRLAAAQDAVRAYITAQDPDTRIGLVIFSGSAQLAVPPTDDHDRLLKSVNSLTTGRGTTIGAAILKSVDAIATIDPDVAPSDAAPGGSGGVAGADPKTGRFAPAVVVLLTDGANTAGIAPVDAAKIAAARGVRVYPIGFGTDHPTNLVCTAAQLGGGGFDTRGGGFAGTGSGTTGGFPNPRALGLVVDEPTLREVAQTTGGTYYAAERGDELQTVLKNLPWHVQREELDVEITVGLTGLATLLILLGMAAAARWTTFPS